MPATRSFFVRTGLLCLGLACTEPRSASGAWPPDPLTNVPVCTAAGSQNTPNIATDGEGGAIIAWIGSGSVFAQHMLTGGIVDPAWPADGRALCTAAIPGDNQFGSHAVADGAHGAIVVWVDQRNGADDIYAQHVLAGGIVDPTWPPDGVAVCTAAGSQYYPTIAPDGSGGAIIAWDDGSAGGDIYAQHVLASGIVDPTWPANGRGVCVEAHYQGSAIIATDGVGGAIIAWHDARAIARAQYAQHVLASGIVDPAWPVNGRALGATANEIAGAAIVSDGYGGALVAWSAYPLDLRWRIYVQHVLPGGTLDPGWPTGGRPMSTNGDREFIPLIVTDGAEGAIVGWALIPEDAGNGEIYVQHVREDGMVDRGWPTDGRLVGSAERNVFPALASDGSGGAYVSWSSPNADIYAHRVASCGEVDPVWNAGGTPVCTAAGSQRRSAIIAAGAGNAIVTWDDGRNGDLDINAQKLTPPSQGAVCLPIADARGQGVTAALLLLTGAVTLSRRTQQGPPARRGSI